MTKTIRTAIYTRKSHEGGLEQAFNSLDAQRTAAEHYIASHAHEGWIALPQRYDDGGYSGGTMVRPALQRLLEDIKAGHVDCVVVYKIDRLSRALSDFSRIMDVFDAQKVNFVSITQSFNTSTSMGRLMLNVLLSFAQFEREVTGERIRDKFTLSRQKGLWMGGTPPLGYDVKERKLVINSQESALVQIIFERFVTMQSLMALVQELRMQGHTTKTWVSASGRHYEGQPFTTGALRHILTDPVYKGYVAHKGQVYSGAHDAIIKEELWQRAQYVFATEVRGRDRETSDAPSPALLKGLLFCGPCKTPMVPSYAKRRNRRYHYYACNARRRGLTRQCSMASIAASAVDNIVVQYVRRALRSPEMIAAACKETERQLPEQTVIAHMQRLDALWQELFTIEQRRIVQLVVKGVTIEEGNIAVRLNVEGLSSLLAEFGDDLALKEAP